MKVLQINVTVNTGSTGRIAEQIGSVIEDQGHKSFIAHSRKKVQSRSKTIQIGNKVDFYMHAINSRLFDNHGFSSKYATKKLVKTIKKIQPDLIHLHNLHGYYVHVGVLFNFLNSIKTPVVWTFHDCWPFTGHCAYFDRVDCEKWKKECHSCPLKSYYPSSLFLDNSSHNFKTKKELFAIHPNLTIVTPSHWLMKLTEQSFFKNSSIKVIHNGIDLSVFKPAQQDKDNHKQNLKRIVLGVASIWDSRKGLDDFIKLNDVLDDGFQIILVGLSKKQVNTLPSSMIGIERTENIEELVKLYSRADVYVNATYSDNFPTTNIEALACGTPVITYDTGGSPEAIDKNTGIVVERGNVEELKKAIDIISKEKTKFTADVCRERAINHFNKDERFMDYFNLYEKLINSSK